MKVEAEAGNEKSGNYHHGNLREALIDIACTHIRDAGMEKLSLRAIAKQAGVSANAPYRHFPDKRSLLIAIAIAGFEQLARGMRDVEAQALPILEEMRLKGRHYIECAIANPEKYKLMFGPAISERTESMELMVAAGISYELLLKTVRQGVEEGVFRRAEVRALAEPIWAQIHGISSLLIDGFFNQNVQDFRTAWVHLGPAAPCPLTYGCEHSLEDTLNNFFESLLLGIASDTTRQRVAGTS